MTFTFRNAGGVHNCTEYIVKAGETVESIAKVYLGDASMAKEIKFAWDPSGNNKMGVAVPLLLPAKVKANDIVLIPPVADSIKNKNTNVRDQLTRLDNEVNAQSITADEYFRRRDSLLRALGV